MYFFRLTPKSVSFVPLSLFSLPLSLSYLLSSSLSLSLSLSLKLRFSLIHKVSPCISCFFISLILFLTPPPLSLSSSLSYFYLSLANSAYHSHAFSLTLSHSIFSTPNPSFSIFGTTERTEENQRQGKVLIQKLLRCHFLLPLSYFCISTTELSSTTLNFL